MSRTPIFDALKEYNGMNRGYFRIPGHRFENGIPSAFTDFAGKNIFKLDVTETPLTDDLHNPKSVIAASQYQTAEAFGAGKSFYLVNGTTCGNESMIIAAAAEEEKILIPRNAHKSVMAGLIFSGAHPIYMPVDFIPELGLSGILKPDTASGLLHQHPDAKAVFAVSPSYHGFCSDIAALSASAHGCSIPLLVDEAHGAHLYFSSSLPHGALQLGADACSQSLHKTAGALTQSSLLHISREAESAGRIDSDRLDSALRMTMSTSPSYLLMTSLELTRADLEQHGSEYWDRTIELADELRNRINAIAGFSCPSPEALKNAGIQNADPTRLVVNCDETGCSGYELKTLLWRNSRIDVEMADARNILIILTYGNNKKDADTLIEALKSLADSSAPAAGAADRGGNSRLPAIPAMALTPRAAYFSKTNSIPWNEMKGRVIAEPVAVYPPGIPLIYPGEVITDEIFDYLDNVKKRKMHLHGPADKTLSTVKICELS